MISFSRSIHIRFIFALLFATAWLICSILLGYHWFQDLAHSMGHIIAICAITFIALIPGFMNAFLLAAYILDKQPPITRLNSYPSISILIAAYNEADSIQQTLLSILEQHYANTIEIIVIDDGSTDQTIAAICALKNSNIKILNAAHGGKAAALNLGLQNASHDIIVTIDADTHLLPHALTHLIEHLEVPGQNRVSSVGSIYSRNHDQSWIAHLQFWDYFSGIAVIKRTQSLFKGTLVAQGAFSAYRKHTLLECGGWPTDVIGEDIVITWRFIQKNYNVGYADNAIALTNVPTTYKKLFQQRRRWSRGLIESFKSNPSILKTRRLSVFFIYWNLLFPFIDLAYVFIFFPGILAAFFGYTLIVSYCTLAYTPLAIATNIFIMHKQLKLHHQNGLQTKVKMTGFFSYIFLYTFLTTPACINGYLQELLALKKSWGTK